MRPTASTTRVIVEAKCGRSPERLSVDSPSGRRCQLGHCGAGGGLASTDNVQEAAPAADARVMTVFEESDVATLDRLVAEVAAGRLKTPIQRTYRLDEVGQAMADFAAGTRGNLAITVD